MSHTQKIKNNDSLYSAMTKNTILGIFLAGVMLCGSIPLGFSEPVLQQWKNTNDINEVQCDNSNHVLVMRDNGNPACVTEKSAKKLGWEIIHTINMVEQIDVPIDNEKPRILSLSNSNETQEYQSELGPGIKGLYPKFNMMFPETVKLGEKFTVNYEYSFVTLKTHHETGEIMIDDDGEVEIEQVCPEFLCKDNSIFLHYPSNVKLVDREELRSEELQVTKSFPSITYNREFIDDIYNNSTDKLVEEISFVFEKPTNDLYSGIIIIAGPDVGRNDSIFYYIGSNDVVYFSTDAKVFHEEFNSDHFSNISISSAPSFDNGVDNEPRFEHPGVIPEHMLNQQVGPDVVEIDDDKYLMEDLEEILRESTDDKTLWPFIMENIGLSENYIRDFFNQYPDLKA